MSNQYDEKQMTEEEKVLLAGKYHSVDALEQGYRELSKQLRDRPAAAVEIPENYELPEGAVDEDLFGHMQGAFRAAGLSQQQVAALAEAFVGYESGLRIDPDAEKQALGADADMVLGRVSAFAQRHFHGAELEEVQSLATTAAGVRVLDKLARLAGEKAVPTEAAATSTAEHLKARAMRLMKEPDFRYNRGKQQEYDRLWSDIVSM